MLLHRLVVLKLGYHCKGGKNVYIVNTENVQTTDHKSDNLQYNTLGRWDKRLIDQVFFFFHNFLQNTLQKSFQFIFFFIIKIKSYECPKSTSLQNNAWNIRQLVD